MRWILLALLGCSSVTPMDAAEPSIQFVRGDGVLGIRRGDVEVARYVFQDKLVPRPYFADVKTPSGIQVTRRHPPQKDQDATDHVGLHTGIWLSFGDLSGCDYWRLKARTEHVRFSEEPTGGPGRGTFAVVNRYLTADGQGTVAEETCQYVIRATPHGYLLEMTSEFRPGDVELVFGDQEEMGLGIRVATPLNVDRKLGGRLLDSAGRRNGAEAWGKTADWCDYAGSLQGPDGVRWVGMTVLAGPDNFRRCWSHARDYGFLAMNPFGRQAFTKQEPSRIVVARGETLKLRYGVAIHESPTEADYHPAAIYQDFAGQTAASPK